MSWSVVPVSTANGGNVSSMVAFGAGIPDAYSGKLYTHNASQQYDWVLNSSDVYYGNYLLSNGSESGYSTMLDSNSSFVARFPEAVWSPIKGYLA